MSRVRGSLVLIVTFVGFLLGISLNAAVQRKKDSPELVLECVTLREQFRGLSNAEAARELYQKAYVLSFDDRWQEADAASQCAALLHHGQIHWSVEAQDLIN